MTLDPMWAWSTHTHTPTANDSPTVPTLPLHSYPACPVQIHLVVGGVPVLLLLILINKLSSVSTSLAPDLKGVGVKGHQWQPRGRRSWHNIYDLSLDKLTVIIKLTALIKTVISLAVWCWYSLLFLFRPTSGCQKYLHNAHSSQLKNSILWLVDLTSSTGPKR